jgi:hypothetical protein
MQTAEILVETVDGAAARYRKATDAAASVRPSAGEWSAKEVLGHLIDSAGNNLQRFVRAQQEETLVFPGYAQDHWVRTQGYQSTAWPELVQLWQLSNHHLARVIRRIPPAALSTECRIGTGDPVTLGFLVDDYVVHMQHHLTQIDARLVRP